ncbi:MAG TPA: diguanylate cyclase [bacterium]|nr:diguanylate cyclase [bacterium]HOL46766.1 diguanylate cyclase [bacterium]HPQ17721.1 diguanylate cyclase [bacterium]
MNENKESILIAFEIKQFCEKLVNIIINELFFESCCIAFIDYTNKKINILEAQNVISEIIFKFQFDAEKIIINYLEKFEDFIILNINSIIQTSEKEKKLLFFPIKKNKKVVGFIFVTKREANDFTKFDLKFLKNYAELFSQLISKLAIDLETANFNFKDSLTNLYNQDYFYEILNREIEEVKINNSEFSIIMIELKNYMNYFEKYGETVANKLIIKISQIITHNLRRIDICTLFYGNIIAIISPDLNYQEALNKIKNIKNIIENTIFEIDDVTLSNIEIRFGLKSFSGREKIKSNLIIREVVKSIGKIVD